jgi:hypothetical protein
VDACAWWFGGFGGRWWVEEWWRVLQVVDFALPDVEGLRWRFVLREEYSSCEVWWVIGL